MQVDINLVVIEYNKGNHGLVMESTLVTEKVVQHLTKCMDYHQLKTVIIPIDYTISTHCCRIIEIVLYIFIHIFAFLYIFIHIFAS